jgi:hypothetical protein
MSIDNKFSKFATSRSPNNLKAEPSRFNQQESEGERPDDLLKKQ